MRGRVDRRWRPPAGAGPAAVLAAMVALVVIGPFAAPNDPVASLSTAYLVAGGEFPLGTDNLGRDVLSRVLAGGWPVLVLPAVAVTISTSVGVAAGLTLVAGPRRGRRTGQVLDLFLVLPPVLVLVILAFVLGPGTGTLLIIITVLSAPFTGRQVRALADPLLDTGFVHIALTEGHGRGTVVLREVLPNIGGPVLADAGNRLVGAVYLVASASFLGISPLPGSSDWASMVADALGGIMLNPAAVLAPALAIGLVTVPVNLLADRAAR